MGANFSFKRIHLCKGNHWQEVQSVMGSYLNTAWHGNKLGGAIHTHRWHTSLHWLWRQLGFKLLSAEYYCSTSTSLSSPIHWQQRDRFGALLWCASQCSLRRAENLASPSDLGTTMLSSLCNHWATIPTDTTLCNQWDTSLVERSWDFTTPSCNSRLP